MKCPFCGTVNPADETFCANCGGYLDTSTDGQTVIGQVNSQMTGPTQVASGSSGNVGATTTGGGTKGNSMTLTPSSQLQNGRYVVEKILGQGGMGAAVLARDTRVSNKRVVIKELISDESDPQQKLDDERNFEREVETLASLDHPLIPTVTDSFKEGARYYMVQEYAPGENLEAYMERFNRPMPEQEALTYISQVLDILEYLNDQTPPIVHRDIKPANIIISSRDKRARLVDFGIARADEAKNAQHKQTTALGTPGYAPPEQYQGNADGRSDLYALAATLHHLVTNRDPRDFPPFSYPPARSLNSKITVELERILERALMIDINKRYQSATAMKADIDELLSTRFNTSNKTSSYLLNSSAGITAAAAPPPPPPKPTPPPSYQSGYGQVRKPQPNPVSQSPYSINQNQQRGSQSNRQQQSYAPYPRAVPNNRREPNYVVMSLILLILVVVIIAALVFGLPLLTHTGSAYPINSVTPTKTATPTVTYKNPISVAMIKGEPIGLSEGNYAFDTSRKNAATKQQAVAAYTNYSQAATLWGNADNGNSSTGDSSDAEAHIYQEDARVLASGSPHITFVIGTILSGANASVGADDLQGAYIAQSEWNSQNKLGQVKVLLIIANAGSNSSNASTVAEQIVQAAAKDPTIVGVMGWSFSGHTINALGTLAHNHIPLVSATASSDELTGMSPDFFRVAPSNQMEATVGATYAQNILKAQSAVVFQDPSDAYSNGLGNDFQTAFKGKISQVITYKMGDTQSIINGLASIKINPGLIYFSGYASDMDTLLIKIPNYAPLAQTKILGGDALYELGGYSTQARLNLYRLHFTAFAYPDEWDVLGDSSKKPAFFADYTAAYAGAHPTAVYGFTRASGNVMLSYDAMLALLTSAKTALNGGTALKPTQLQAALVTLKNLQGVSGNITLDSNGDAVNKAIVILSVDKDNHIHMENKLGAGTLLAA